MAGPGRADEGGRGAATAGATRWRGSSAAAAPPWRSNPSPGRSGRSARRWRCSGRRWPSGWPRSPRGRSCWRCSGVAGLGAAGAARARASAASAGRAPTAARARIDATLPGRPLATLRDTPALGRDDPGRAGGLGGAPGADAPAGGDARGRCAADLRLASRDPWALRLVALVALIAALVFARDRGVEAVAAALQPGAGRGGGGRAELRGLGRAARLYRPADALPARGAGRRAGGGAARAPW